jgi:hypothetical protein
MDYPELVSSFLKFCSIREESINENRIDLSDNHWFYPTTLLPLGDFILSKTGWEFIPPADENLCNYVLLMMHSGTIHSTSAKSYLPIIKLPKSDTGRGQEALKRLYPQDGNWKIIGGQNAYMLLIEELTANIYDHSEFSNAMVMGQRYDNKGFVELCIFDNGISIAGSYEHRLGIKSTGLEAIKQAIRGYSTKSNVERGTGLPNTLNLVVDGLKGEIMIVSGDGLLFMDDFSNALGVDLKEESHRLKGTLVSVRFPLQSGEVNVYDYIK